MSATASHNTLASITQLETQLNSVFYERREVIHGALCAILAGEHVLLLGPAGTGKSAIVRALAQAFGGTYFERLLTKFSTPEEIFGPISLSALEHDRYERITVGKLPEAHFAFADEVFKANSAILNSLLALVNERVFHNDGAATRVPRRSSAHRTSSPTGRSSRPSSTGSSSATTSRTSSVPRPFAPW